MMIQRRILSISCVLLVLGVTSAQEAKKSTAQPGEFVPSTFRAQLVVDDRFPPKVNPPIRSEDRDPRDRTNKIHCLVCENGLSPVIAVFVRADTKTFGPESGVVKLAKAIDKLIPEYRGDKLAGFVIFCKAEGPSKNITLTNPDGSTLIVELDAEYPDDEKRDAIATEIRDLAKAANAPNVPFGMAPLVSKAAEGWGIAPEDEITVVIYNRLRVAQRWKFPATGPNDEQIQEIVSGTEEMITGMKKSKK